ncbi:MAG: transcriptional repressor [Candidatus Dormibacteraeota bacterium]|nr:transcriptional repressor [Candidatus Dormibacteraeota bacterium]
MTSHTADSSPPRSRAGGVGAPRHRPPPRESLQRVGLRVTPQRLAVLAILYDAHGRHLSADDVWQHLSAVESSLDRSTAYRVLADLTDAGLLTQVRFADGVARFEVQSDVHHHAVCRRCGATEDVPAELVGPLSDAIERATGFVVAPEEPVLVRGLCRACAAPASPPG